MAAKSLVSLGNLTVNALVNESVAGGSHNRLRRSLSVETGATAVSEAPTLKPSASMSLRRKGSMDAFDGGSRIFGSDKALNSGEGKPTSSRTSLVQPSIQETKAIDKPSRSVLPVIKENKLNEAQYNNTSLMKAKTQMDYSDIVCTSCKGSLLQVYHHCLADQDKAIPSPHHVDEVADAKRKRAPPFFELLKDPTVPRNIHYKDLGEKSNREIKARNLSRRIDDFQRGAILSYFEKNHVNSQSHPPVNGNNVVHTHNHDPKAKFQHKFNQGTPLPPLNQAQESERNDASPVPSEASKESFQGSLYRHTLQIKNYEIERLREQLLEKSESEGRELENVRRLKKALAKSMKYYIKAEEWQQEEASTLQDDIRTLKKEMSAIMACLIHSESEKKELRSVIAEKDKVIESKDAHIQQMDAHLAEMRTKLHESLKDYIRVNEKISNMAKQAETGSDQAEQRNNILQKNLDNVTKSYTEASLDLNKHKKKVAELEHELEFFVRQINDLSRLKKELIKENESMQQELFGLQQDVQRYMDSDLQDKMKISALDNELKTIAERYDTILMDKDQLIADLKRSSDEYLQSKKEEEANNAKLTSENTRLKATLKDTAQKKDLLEATVRDLQELRKNEIVERDRIIQELTEQTKLAKSEALMFEERRERAMLQLNDLQGALDHEMTQNRMMMVEIERQKRDYQELKSVTRTEIEKLMEMRTTLTNDKVSLTKHVYELRQELKEKKEEHSNLVLEYRSYQVETREKVKTLEAEIERLNAELSDLNAKYSEITTQYQSLTNVHDALTSEHHALLTRFDDSETSLKRVRMEYSNLISYKDGILKEKADITARKDELEISYEKLNQKNLEILAAKATMEKEFKIQAAARESLISSLSGKVEELKEDLRRMTASNNQFKDFCSKLNQEQDQLRREMQDLFQLKASFEEKLDQMRRELSNERKVRLEFERMNQRLDQKLADRQMDRLQSMRNRDKTLKSMDENMNQEMGRLNEIVDIILRPPPEVLAAVSGASPNSTNQSRSTPLNILNSNGSPATLKSTTSFGNK